MPTISTRRRLLTTSTASSAFAITAGMYTVATLATALSVTEAVASDMIIPLGGREGTPRFRGIEVTAFGTGADNATMSFRVWQLKRGLTSSSTRLGGKLVEAGDFELALLCSVTCILSTAVGAASGTLVASTERIADSMTATASTAATTPKGQSAMIDTAYGSATLAAFAPADNTPARLYVPDVGGGDILIEPIVGTATAANVIVEAQT